MNDDAKKVEAAGRMLSQESVESIMVAWRSLTLLLIEAEHILPGQVLPELLYPNGQDVEASRDISNRAAGSNFQDLPVAPDDDSETSPPGSDREAVSEQPSEAEETTQPKTQTDQTETPSDEQQPSREGDVGFAASSETNTDTSKEAATEQYEVSWQNCDRLQLEFAVSARASSEMSSPYSATNERAIEGILFQTDAISDGSPNVGPGMPLYIPRSVAEVAIADINNSQLPKPLDAHDSLSQHANTDIVGAIVNARLENNDFVVRGILWDANQPQKVQSILAAKDRLGMSVNAVVKGQPAQIEGRQVFWIDDIRVLGANILFADKATYRGTRILSASNEDKEQTEMTIAAASNTQKSSQQGVQMDGQNMSGISDQLRRISASLDQMTEQFDEELQNLRGTTGDIDKRLQAIEAERSQKQEEVQAAARQEEKEKERNALLEEMQRIIDEKISPLKAQQTSQGRRVPQRKTTPLAAGAASSEETSESRELELQLARLDGELNALYQGTQAPDYTRMIELQEEKRELLNRMQ